MTKQFADLDLLEQLSVVMKDLAGFVRLIYEMRMAQKKYFRTRKQDDLINAKEIEAKVDALLGRKQLWRLLDDSMGKNLER